ncbi:MAG: cadherin-like beta sandwich domain-containing protein [Spirochaetes bacterium]|nr:cadherin-like beta sandwich domain-containing protein [Spirochaetota bacterium]
MKKTMKSLAMIITAAVLIGGCDSGKSGKSMLPYATPFAAAGSSAALKSLEVLNFTISPAFAPEVAEYTLVVKKAETTSVTVKAIASDGASVTVGLNDLTPAAVSATDHTAPVALDATKDVNTVTVNVTSEDGAATMAYLVRIYYYGTSASLSGLSVAVTAGSLGGVTANLAPAFDAAVTAYTAGISCYVSCLDVTVHLPDGAGMTAAVNGWTATSGVAVPITALPAATKTGTITVTVTSQDKSATKTYTISITKGALPSSEAHLKNLVLRSYRIYNGKTGITGYSWGEEVLTPVVSAAKLLTAFDYAKTFTDGVGTYQPYQFQILATPLDNTVSGITGLVTLNSGSTTGFTFTKDASTGVYTGEVTGPTATNWLGQTYGHGLTEAYLDVTAEDGTVIRYKVMMQVN